MIVLEHVYPASPERIWELWTTRAGIESWWSPDGFEVEVRELELRPGGELRYAMIATAPETIEFVENAGLPLATESLKTYTQVEPVSKLVYSSLVDYVPGVPPYEHLTAVELSPEGDGTRVTMTMEPMHDDDWTGRLVAGRKNELANLALVV